MSCQHAEDVCQHCLEKVQREDSSEEEQETLVPVLPPKKLPRGTRTLAEKRRTVLCGSLFIALSGYTVFQSRKLLYELFDINVVVAKEMLRAIMAPTREE